MTLIKELMEELLRKVPSKLMTRKKMRSIIEMLPCNSPEEDFLLVYEKGYKQARFEIYEKLIELAKKDWEKYKTNLVGGGFHLKLDYFGYVNDDIKEITGSEKGETCGIDLYRRNLKSSRVTPSEKPEVMDDGILEM